MNDGFAKKFVGVIFLRFNKNTKNYDEVFVEPKNIVNHHQQHGGRVERVVWSDGSLSWGKHWYEDGNRAVIARIGAGAYGDLTVWENPEVTAQ